MLGVRVKADVICGVQRLWRALKVTQVAPPKEWKQLCLSENNLAALNTEPVCSCEGKCAASSTGHL